MHRAARPIRSIVPTVVVALSLLGVSACDAGRPAAARVDGAAVSVEHLDAVIEALAEVDPERFEGAGEGTFATSATTNVLTFLISQVAVGAIADERGLIPSEENRTNAADQLVTQLGGSGEDGFGQEVVDALPDSTRDWLVDRLAQRAALLAQLDEEAVTDDSELVAQAREVYDADPAAFSTVCPLAILIDGADEEAVRDRLDAGEDFGEVSAEVSIDEAIAEASGAFGECSTREAIVAGLIPEAGELIETADIGVPTDSIELDQGAIAFFQLEAGADPSFDEVRDQIVQQLVGNGTAGEALLAALVEQHLSETDISVDPRFGRWDDDTLQVVPPAGPSSPGG